MTIKALGNTSPATPFLGPSLPTITAIDRIRFAGQTQTVSRLLQMDDDLKDTFSPADCDAIARALVTPRSPSVVAVVRAHLPGSRTDSANPLG
jgi:hypothetical protein